MTDGVWHVALRDILIITSALALLVSLTFVSLIAWQIYRLVREFRKEIAPIIMAIQDTAETVRDASDFVGTRLVTPAADALGGAADSTGILRLIGRLNGRGGSGRAVQSEDKDATADGGAG